MSGFGCAQPSDFEQYVQRLDNVLDVESPVQIRELADLSSLQIPAARHRLSVKPTSMSMGVREFLSLKQCQLHQVLADRNSQMGRVAGPSQRLINDVQIIQSIPDCIEAIADTQPSLAAKLAQMRELKQQQLSISIAHSLIAGPEYSMFWQLSRDEFAAESQDGTLQQSLRYLAELATQTNVNIDDFEFHLSVIRGGEAGRWLLQLLELHTSLAQANRMVESRLQKPMCLSQQPTPKARYFANVVELFFIAKVQVQAVRLERKAEQIMPHIVAIESALGSTLSPEYEQWRKTRNELIARARQAPKRHSLLLAKLYEQCGLRPGNRD